MADDYASHAAGLDAPIEHAAAVTPSDTVDLATASRALYVGSTGDLRVTTVGGDTVTFADVPVGWHPIRARRVLATSTTATDIVACW